jgi:hypothetical protein
MLNLIVIEVNNTKVKAQFTRAEPNVSYAKSRFKGTRPSTFELSTKEAYK